MDNTFFSWFGTDNVNIAIKSPKLAHFHLCRRTKKKKYYEILYLVLPPTAPIVSYQVGVWREYKFYNKWLSTKKMWSYICENDGNNGQRCRLSDDKNVCIPEVWTKERSDSLDQPLQKTREWCSLAAPIRSFAFQLATVKRTGFGEKVDRFISCTMEDKRASPKIVMSNMRQFMTGMKNFVVALTEKEFKRTLTSTEYLNLYAILERVMHKLVVRPLKEHLYKLFVEEYSDTGAIQLLAENIKYARKHPEDIGITFNILSSEESMDEICSYLQLMQDVYSPLEKMDCLRKSIDSIVKAVKRSVNRGGMCGADEILPFFIWVLVQSGMVAAEIQADYMKGLLEQSELDKGEVGYCLTTLLTAVEYLKSINPSRTPLRMETRTVLQVEEIGSKMKIIVLLNDISDSILIKTLLVKPNMTSEDVCKMIARKVRVTNPQDYALHKIIDGEETILDALDCPQAILRNI
ncbi:hypothetical protein GE061_011936 [Apolygus lucorum]|uniref:VPS9 domain-containing protein n=1 Tax=Apolygus lucorum TaxID=248454 RepID=A0A8S9XS28_APOLU|nr:hypothetical protein GE061_011936 [Apolygus lucorum]